MSRRNGTGRTSGPLVTRYPDAATRRSSAAMRSFRRPTYSASEGRGTRAHPPSVHNDLAVCTRRPKMLYGRRSSEAPPGDRMEEHASHAAPEGGGAHEVHHGSIWPFVLAVAGGLGFSGLATHEFVLIIAGIALLFVGVGGWLWQDAQGVSFSVKG